VCFGEAVTDSALITVDGAAGVRLNVIRAGRPGAPLVVLAHGFPELAYTWRHQVPALAAAGYRVLAPDQRGYGGSSCPEAVAAYDIHALTGDLVALLDAADAERAVFVGHDWGATVVWNLAQLRPDRVAGVAGLSVPPVPRPRTTPTAAFRKFGDDFYILRFQEPGVADAELGADPRATIRALMAGAADAPLPDWLTADDLEFYASEFGRTGFTGGLNWYRNMDRNWASTAKVPAPTVAVPALFIGGRADPVLGFTRTDRAREVVTGYYREEWLDAAGHWIPQDHAAEVNRILLEFLDFCARTTDWGGQR